MALKKLMKEFPDKSWCNSGLSCSLMSVPETNS